MVSASQQGHALVPRHAVGHGCKACCTGLTRAGMWAPLVTVGQLPPDGVLGRAILELPSVHGQVLAREQALVLAASAGRCKVAIAGELHRWPQPRVRSTTPHSPTSTDKHYGPDAAAAQHVQQANARHSRRGTILHQAAALTGMAQRPAWHGSAGVWSRCGGSRSASPPHAPGLGGAGEGEGQRHGTMLHIGWERVPLAWRR